MSGRLDADTEGLMLLTNDGELAHRLSHPSMRCPRHYLAMLTGPVPHGLGRTLRAGIGWTTDRRSSTIRGSGYDPGKTLVRVTRCAGTQSHCAPTLAAAGSRWRHWCVPISARCHWKATPGQRPGLAFVRDRAAVPAVGLCESPKAQR